MAKDTDTATEAPRKLFATSPSDIVIYESRPYDEPVMELVFNSDGKTDGKKREVGRSTGETLHVRSEKAHIEGKTAYPLDGSDPIPYGPGKAGCWGKNALNDR